MAAAHRDFDARPRSAPESAGSFTLGGVQWVIRSRTEVPFELVRRMLGLDADEFVTDPDELAKMSEADQRTQGRAVLVRTDEFFAATIVENQVEAFLAMVHDPTGPFTVAMSTEITNYIAGTLFGADEENEGVGPTIPPKSSRPGRVSTGSTSKVGSSSPATPKLRSAG